MVLLHYGTLALWAALVCLSAPVEGRAVMSVDFGSEFIKVAVAQPGTPMEIALNKESSRKTPGVVSFRDGERLFGNAALGTSIRFPKLAYRYLLNLLGQKIDSPAAAEYRSRFPHHKLVEDKVRGTVCFEYSDSDVYCVEELVAMMLNNSRESAELFLEQPIQGCVITVPSYFGQAERRAMLFSAKLIGLSVLQLLNSNVGVALNYGVFRREMVDEAERTVMFFDMGASSTTVTIASYQTLKVTEMGSSEIVPHLTVRSVAFDRSLGGLEMDFRLRDHLADVFDGQKKVPESVRTSPRAMAKLLKEANRVKQVLSANTAHMAQIEGLLPDVDFKAKVTRAKFEELCHDLFERVEVPIEQAMKAAEIDEAVLENVVVVGGASRVPKVQRILKEVTQKTELGKSVNSDEAAALGAAFAAVAMAPGFRQQKFGVKDVNLFPIDLTYRREIENGSMKHVHRVLCNKLSINPQKRVMTFNKFRQDFEFTLNYGDLAYWLPRQVDCLGPKEFMRVAVTGLKEAIAKLGADNFHSVKAHFNLDVSGLVAVDHVDAMFSKPVGNSSKSKDSDIKPTLRHFKLSYNSTRQDISPQLKSVVAASKARLRKMAELDEDRKLRGMIRNSLETRLIEAQEQLHCDGAAEECSRLSQKLTDLSDWLYGDGSTADLSTLKKKVKKLERISNKVRTVSSGKSEL